MLSIPTFNCKENTSLQLSHVGMHLSLIKARNGAFDAKSWGSHSEDAVAVPASDTKGGQWLANSHKLEGREWVPRAHQPDNT